MRMLKMFGIFLLVSLSMALTFTAKMYSDTGYLVSAKVLTFISNGLALLVIIMLILTPILKIKRKHKSKTYKAK